MSFLSPNQQRESTDRRNFNTLPLPEKKKRYLTLAYTLLQYLATMASEISLYTITVVYFGGISFFQLVD